MDPESPRQSTPVGGRPGNRMPPESRYPAGAGLRWYRSLYWRIALGLIAFLALMLAAEAALFLWVTDRVAGSMPARSPRRLAVLVASDVGAAMTAEPALDVEQYVREQFEHVFQTFVIVMRDGRVLSNHDDVPEGLLAIARAESAREAVARLRRPGGRGPRLGGGARALPGFDGADPGGGSGGMPELSGTPDDRGRARRRFGGPDDTGDRPPAGGSNERRQPLPRIEGGSALLLVGGLPAGRVVVLPGGPPFSRVVSELGPTVGLVAGGVLGVGATLVALLVFGPTRRRLKHLQEATERLGLGDLDARAPEHGGDEVAALAASFNRMAEELASRTQALEASDKARRQLLADVSHELMTPLTAMRGYIETLGMSDLALDVPTRERYLAIVNEETHRLERIVGDLLDMARLEGGGTTLRREAVPVQTLFDRVAARHHRELSERAITLMTDVAPGAEQVAGDPDRLEQVLQNLASNALRHTPDGGEIALTAARADSRVRLVVRDSGPGIPADHLPLIFDRFYKADAARKAAGGSGLGLSIVKAIIERHDGTIAARNDGGAVFEILLPAGSGPGTWG